MGGHERRCLYSSGTCGRRFLVPYAVELIDAVMVPAITGSAKPADPSGTQDFVGTLTGFDAERGCRGF